MVQTLRHAVPPAIDRSVSRFEIHAEHCLQLFAKITGLFATRSILPHSIHMRRSPNGMWLAIEAMVADEAGERLAERLRGLVAIDAVIHIPAPSAGPMLGGMLASAARTV